MAGGGADKDLPPVLEPGLAAADRRFDERLESPDQKMQTVAEVLLLHAENPRPQAPAQAKMVGRAGGLGIPDHGQANRGLIRPADHRLDHGWRAHRVGAQIASGGDRPHLKLACVVRAADLEDALVIGDALH